MFEILKKKSIQATLKFSAIALAVGAVLFAMSIGDILKVVKGPTPLSELQETEYDKQYVQMNMELSLGSYMEMYEVDKKTEKETTQEVYYIVPNEEGMLLGVKFKVKDTEQADLLSQQTVEWLYEERDSIESSILVEGTLSKMPEEDRGFFVGALQDMGYTQEEINQWTIPYYITYNNLAFENIFGKYIMLAIATLLFLLIPYKFIRAWSGAYQKEISEYSLKNIGISLKDIEEDFANAIHIAKKVWIGDRWTIFCDGSKSRIIANEEIVWAYYKEVSRTKNGITTTTRTVEIYDKDKKRRSIEVKKEEQAKEILNEYEDNYPHIVLGYSEELEEYVTKHFEDFLAGVEQRRLGEVAICEEGPEPENDPYTK